MKKRILLIVAALFPVWSAAQTFRVGPLDDLVATVEEAANYSRQHPGKKVSVLLSDGAYTLRSPIRLEHLGGPFCIAAAPQAHPLIQGDTDLSGWILSGLRPGVLETSIPEDVDPGVPVGDENRIDFYADGIRQELARWPNGSIFTYAGNCIDPASHEAVRESKQGILEYRDERMVQWAQEQDPCLLGYWCFDWSESFKRLGSIDRERHTFAVLPAKESYGYRSGCRFYGFNLLCELDAPGEYYIDRRERKIYWAAPADFLDHPTSTRISVFDGTSMISAENCDRLSIEGLELRGGRGMGIVLKGGSRCRIANCHIHCFAEEAVHIEGGHSHCVKDCSMEQLGKGGLDATGGDRPTLESAGLDIGGCRIHDFALYKHTYCPAVRFHGVGARIHHCEMYNSTSSAMRVEGNDILVEHNFLHDVVRESDDQGGIESFGDMSYRRIVVRHNRFSDINGGTNCGSAAVRFDDLISGNEVYDNIFERCGSFIFGAVQIHGGRDNRIHHNTFVDCHSSISHTPWSWAYYQQNLPRFSGFWKGIDLQGKLFTSRYPELRTPTDSTNLNTNFFYKNRSIRCGEPIRAENLVMKGNTTEGAALSSLHRMGAAKLDTVLLERYITASQQTRIRNGKQTGSQVIVYQDGKIVLDKCFGTKYVGGPALKGNEIYRVASMTKPVTALALLIELDRGHLKLEDDLGTYLPEFAGKNIRLSQLVSHVSGVMDTEIGEGADNPFTLNSAVRYLAAMPLAFEPGTRTVYSTGAFDLAAKVIELVSGMDYESYLRTHIFDKLGMDDTRFTPSEEQWGRFVAIHARDSLGCAYDKQQKPGCIFVDFPVSYPMAGAGLASTAADYMKLARLLLDHGTASSGERILGWNNLCKMSTPSVSEEVMPGSQRWGLGVRTIVDDNYILPKGSYGWSGYYGTHFWVDPENNIAVVYMKNSTYDGGAGCQTAIELEQDVMNSLVK